MPWHYHDPFFQESPAVFEADLDAPFAKADLLKLCREFYAGIGLPVDRVIARSDLLREEGQEPARLLHRHRPRGRRARAGQHRAQRVLDGRRCCTSSATRSTAAKNIPAALPYVAAVRGAHPDDRGRGDDVRALLQVAARGWRRWAWRSTTRRRSTSRRQATQRNQLLIFSRWCQVMLRFEKGMYENPEQDLNKLWWDLVEKYQQVRRPRGPRRPRTTPARSTSSARRSTTTTT